MRGRKDTPDENIYYWEGYNCMGPKTRNPYAMEALSEEGRQKYEDWERGWKARYHGE